MIAAMLKSAIVLAVAACVVSFLKRQSAAVRHAVWTAGLLGALTIPLCSITVPPWQMTIAQSVLEITENLMTSLEPIRRAAITLWITGAAAGLLLLLYSAGRLAWVAVGAEPIEDARWAAVAEEVRRSLGIRRPVRLLQNRTVPFLGTWGILVPRVLLPRDAETWPDERIRMVLAHELAHIQRHDWVVQILADAARAIYWFNPIFWLASARLRRESEHACDDAVIRLGAAGPRYAEELLAMTRALRAERRFQSPILAMAQPSHLEQRLIALLNPSLNRLAATPWAVLVVAAVAVGLTLPLAAFRPGEITVAANESSRPQTRVETAVASTPKPAAPTATVDQTARLRTQKPSDSPKPSLNVAVQPAVVAEPIAPVSETAANADSAPAFECNVTPSTRQMKTATVEKMALGNGPWIINDDRTMWAADQPYVANTTINTIWMRPANTELTITARRLDGDAPELRVGPAAPYQTGFIAVGVEFPAAGCWEVTGTAGDNKLTFVTRVRD